MRHKYVKENLDEQYSSSSTGSTDLYITYSPKEEKSEGLPVADQRDLSQLIPHPNVKLTPEDFQSYIEFLLNKIFPESPAMAFTVFSKTLQLHPYLTKKPIGFKTFNPYKDSINKFLETFKHLTSK